jgi:hypothetical protein
MASPIAIGAALTRLASHFRVQRSEAEMAIVAEDWKTELSRVPDEILSRAVDSWIIAFDRHPTLSQMIEASLEETRLIARRRAEAGRQGRSNDPPPERVVNPRIATRAIAVARLMKLAPARTWAEMEIRAAMDVSALEEVESLFPRTRGAAIEARGHDHAKGRDGCPVCSRHDHSSPSWREDCPECGAPLPELYEWSTCAGCDGSGYVPVDDFHGSVRPCLICNEAVHRLWEGGHFLPGHRCDLCTTNAKRRPVGSAAGADVDRS